MSPTSTIVFIVSTELFFFRIGPSSLKGTETELFGQKGDNFKVEIASRSGQEIISREISNIEHSAIRNLDTFLQFPSESLRKR